MSYPGDSPASVGIADGANLDAFSRLRVSYPNLQFSTLFDTADRTLYWTGTTATGGTATYHAASATMRLGVTTANGSRVVRQSKQYFAYRAAQSQFVLITFLLAAPKANLRQRVGYFDASEGFYLELADVGEPKMVIQSNASGGLTYESIAQSSWNHDTLSGLGGASNPSGLTLDLTKTQILVLDFQWLGVGRARMGFDIGGQVVYVHEFHHANMAANTLPYIRSPKLPVRYEIENTGITASISELMQICSAVSREGAVDDPTAQRTVWSDPTAAATSTTTLRTVLGVRLKAANIRATLRLLESSINNIDTEVMIWCLVLNPGGTGAAVWADVPGAESITQYSRSQIAVGVDGAGLPNGALSLTLAAGSLVGGATNRGAASVAVINDTVPVVADYAGTPDELWLCCRQVTGSGNTLGTLTVKEIR